MKADILRVISCGSVEQIPSQKAEGGMIAKRSMLLQELGGKYENQYVVTQFGSETAVPLAPGDVIVVTLRTFTRDYNGQVFQDTVANDIVKLK